MEQDARGTFTEVWTDIGRYRIYQNGDIAVWDENGATGKWILVKDIPINIPSNNKPII